MLGSLRLLLSVLVAISHSDISQSPLWIGVIAVVVFFLISGYAITGLLTSRFQQPGTMRWFFVERFARLAPQYYFWLAVTALVASTTSWISMQRPFNVLADTIAYLTVFPLGLQFYLHEVRMLLLPQATSLGIEAVLYVVAPFVVHSRMKSWIAFIICLGVFVLSSTDRISDDLYTYFSAPGPLAFFLIGSWIYRRDWTSVNLGTLLLLASLSPKLLSHFEIEIAIGLLIGVPAVVILAPRRASRLDRLLGDASYGVFLVHHTVFSIIKGVSGMPTFTPFTRVAAVALALLVGYVSFVILERPTIPFRRRLGRSQGSSADGGGLPKALGAEGSRSTQADFAASGSEGVP